MQKKEEAVMNIEEINRLWRRVSPRVERASREALRRAEQLLEDNGPALRETAMLLAMIPVALYRHIRRRGLF